MPLGMRSFYFQPIPELHPEQKTGNSCAAKVSHLAVNAATLVTVPLHTGLQCYCKQGCSDTANKRAAALQQACSNRNASVPHETHKHLTE